MAAAVVKRGAGGHRYQVVLPDGSSFFIPQDLLITYDLHDGKELDEQELESLQSACETVRIKAKALELLARREHSRGELMVKLVGRRMDPQKVQPVLDELEDAGYLDDRRFASLWASLRMSKRPEGSLKISAALAAKGISREIISEVLSDYDEEAALERAAEQLLRRRRLDDVRLARALANRGFSMPLVRRWISSRGEEEF